MLISNDHLDVFIDRLKNFGELRLAKPVAIELCISAKHGNIALTLLEEMSRSDPSKVDLRQWAINLLRNLNDERREHVLVSTKRPEEPVLEVTALEAKPA